MNKRQKAILMEFVVVIVITAVAVLAMINFKDWVNRSEAIGAMESLSKKVLKYRQTHGSVPPRSWVDEQRENLPGYVRLGNFRYRGLWIDFESTPDEILAYAEGNYRSLLVGKGCVVLRMDGRVEWLDRQEFETLLARQQSQAEIEMLHGNEGLKIK
jgi:hypothetical protein